MSPQKPAPFVALASFAVASMAAVIVDGCDPDPAPDPGLIGRRPDGHIVTVDGGGEQTDSGPFVDGASDIDSGINGTGQRCVASAKRSPCGTNALPDYAYVCANGSPPGIAGCALAAVGATADTYCCAENRCVAQPDQDTNCALAGTPRRYQCPPSGDGGSSTIAPPPGCADAGPLLYCCP